MISAHSTPAIFSFRDYVAGGETDGFSALAWLIGMKYQLPYMQVEHALYDHNPMVIIADEENPESVSVCASDEAAIVAYCGVFSEVAR